MEVDGADSDAKKPAMFSLDAETFKKIHPSEYHRRFLTQGVRADGRPLQQFRKPVVTVGVISTAHGSAMVRLGDTTVVCGIKAEVAEPAPARPREGFLVPNVDLPPLSSSMFRPGPPSELTSTISEFVDQLVKSSDMFNLAELCIDAGKAVWVLYADIVCINYQGNVLDAAIIALMAALQHVRLPPATFYEEEDTVRVAIARTVSIRPKKILLPATFGIFDGSIVIADPDIAEEPHLSSQVTIVLDDSGGICGVLKPGGSPVPKDMLAECIGAAEKRGAAILSGLKLMKASA
ncbi:ribosomal protein S5 domain 2-type protein [Gaertneriomyces semiglobifer]|nr:ribosomal protein S5 domain 2-type protein [Gaertneriomyces semiglobifer]